MSTSMNGNLPGLAGSHRIDFDDPDGGVGAAGEPRADRVKLESARRILPEVDEAAVAGKRWWKHPAFVVSMVTTVLAVVAMVVLLVIDPFADDGPVEAVTGLAVSADEGSVSLTWKGAPSGAELYAFDPGDEAPADLSQLVRESAVWIPLSSNLYTPRTCFVVRPLSEEALPALADAAALAAQGGQTICVSDAA